MAAYIKNILFFCLFAFCISQDTNNIPDKTCQFVDYTNFTKRGLSSMYDDARGYGNLTIMNDCSPQKIWTLFRHGPRYNYMDSMKRLKEISGYLIGNILQANSEGKGQLCRKDIEALRELKFDEMSNYLATFLTESGKNELFSIGNRLRDHFPSLLNTTYDPNKFYFGYSQYQRSIQSMRSFTEGLFKLDENYKSYYTGQWDKNAEMNCHTTPIAQKGMNFEDLRESLEYSTSGRLFEKIAVSLSSRTGLPNSVFSKDVIVPLYEACVYKSAQHLRLSPWCRIFQLTDLELMSGRENSNAYFGMGHGSKNSRFFGCNHMKSMTSFFENAIQNKSDGFTMKALFSHSVVLDELFTAMGCFKDSPPLSPDFAKYNAKQNLWSVEDQTPFSANMHAVLYKCGEYNDYELQFFLNEKPIGCCISDSKESCGWREFKKYHNDFVSNCKEDFCQEEGYDSAYFVDSHSDALKITPFKRFLTILILLVLLIKVK